MQNTTQDKVDLLGIIHEDDSIWETKGARSFACLDKVRVCLKRLYDAKQIDVHIFMNMDESVAKLNGCVGACRRILTTPMPVVTQINFKLSEFPIQLVV